MELVALSLCPDCTVAVELARVDCADGHGADCPERACPVCRVAVLLGRHGVPSPWSTPAAFTRAA